MDSRESEAYSQTCRDLELENGKEGDPSGKQQSVYVCAVSDNHICYQLTKAYKLTARTTQVRVSIHVELGEGKELPLTEDVLALFVGMRSAYGEAVEALDLWNGKYSQGVPDVTVEIGVEEDEENWIEATFGIHHLRSSQRLLAGPKALERALITKVYPWHIDGERQYGDDPEPIEDRFVFVD